MPRPNHSLPLSLALAVFALAAPAQQTKLPPAKAPVDPKFPADLVEAGRTRFSNQCAFCHGRDAGGGETGPDLTRAKSVEDDKDGNEIGPIVRNGRPDKGMPAFNVFDRELSELVAYIKTSKYLSETAKGGRKGVDESDLQTGNADAGKAYFNGAGKCTNCHSPTGDLAGLAKRLTGLRLEQRMLYPRGAKAKVKVTLPSGEVIAGALAYQDEFTIGLTDDTGRYRAWPVSTVKFSVDDPAEAHAELLTKYSDDDIHNLMAYLQTLK